MHIGHFLTTNRNVFFHRPPGNLLLTCATGTFGFSAEDFFLKIFLDLGLTIRVLPFPFSYWASCFRFLSFLIFLIISWALASPGLEYLLTRPAFLSFLFSFLTFFLCFGSFSTALLIFSIAFSYSFFCVFIFILVPFNIIL